MHNFGVEKMLLRSPVGEYSRVNILTLHCGM